MGLNLKMPKLDKILEQSNGTKQVGVSVGFFSDHRIHLFGERLSQKVRATIPYSKVLQVVLSLLFLKEI